MMVVPVALLGLLWASGDHDSVHPSGSARRPDGCTRRASRRRWCVLLVLHLSTSSFSERTVSLAEEFETPDFDALKKDVETVMLLAVRVGRV